MRWDEQNIPPTAKDVELGRIRAMQDIQPRETWLRESTAGTAKT